jgi:hypothetical protein
MRVMAQFVAFSAVTRAEKHDPSRSKLLSVNLSIKTGSRLKLILVFTLAHRHLALGSMFSFTVERIKISGLNQALVH